MKCPFCLGRTVIRNTRSSAEGTIRRRLCRSCACLFTTNERPVEDRARHSCGIHPPSQQQILGEGTGIRSVKGTIRIDESDPDLSHADAALRELFGEFLASQPPEEPVVVNSLTGER